MNEKWILFDTETTGVRYPIHILEIFLLRMNGWEPEDAGLHLFINHEVHIPWQATNVHGYTRDFIRRVGKNPYDSHYEIQNYVAGRHMCAHNLPYDFGRCLVPECDRLGLPVPGLRGFCTLQLLRRTLPGHHNYNLGALRDRYGIVSRAHGAKEDTECIQWVLRHKVQETLIHANLGRIEDLINFSRKNPISRCRKILFPEIKEHPTPNE